MKRFGDNKAEHEFSYRKIHGRLEHGYSEEQPCLTESSK
jgi:hypothetical protein